MSTAEADSLRLPHNTRMAVRTPVIQSRIPYGHVAYNEAMDFLIQEARLLDDNLLDQWLSLLAPDIFYSMPTRRTLARRDGPGFDKLLGSFFWENFETLKLRARRLTNTESAFAEDPPSRTRRLLTNLTLYDTDVAGEYAAYSYLLLLRNRDDQTDYHLVSAVRQDIVRTTAAGFRLAQRVILIDQAALGMHNIAIFL
jgi:3-phenylpropionate/cinnamic acid dioxygenase small subunit